MKFSMIFEAQVEFGTPDVERQAIRNCVEQAVFAEEMGFDGVWAVEHHALIEYSHMSAPEIFLTAVAAKTSRIRVGHAAVCMPFGYNHPVRVAERAAMLDIISDGRLNLGAARGGTAQEMSLCGVDPELTTPQVKEALTLHRPLLARGHDRVGLRAADDPAPAEAGRRTPSCRDRCSCPHPPLFLACTNPETVRTRRAVRRRADGARLRRSRGDRRDARACSTTSARARDPDAVVSPGTINDEFVALCPTFLMDDREEAFRKGCRALRFFAEAITPLGGAERCRAGARHRAASTTSRSWPSTSQLAQGRDRARRGAADRGVVDVQHRPRARRRRHRDRLRRAAAGGRRRQRDVPDPDGHAHRRTRCSRRSASSASR